MHVWKRIIYNKNKSNKQTNKQHTEKKNKIIRKKNQRFDINTTWCAVKYLQTHTHTHAVLCAFITFHLTEWNWFSFHFDEWKRNNSNKIRMRIFTINRLTLLWLLSFVSAVWCVVGLFEHIAWDIDEFHIEPIIIDLICLNWISYWTSILLAYDYNCNGIRSIQSGIVMISCRVTFLKMKIEKKIIKKNVRPYAGLSPFTIMHSWWR